MHPKPNSPFPWPYRPRVCEAGIRAQVAAVATVLAAVLLLAYPVPPADAQEAEETPGVEVGEGTVRVGDDVFAGDGCARAGDVVAGDCGESSETQQGDEPAGDKREEKTEQEESKPDEEKPSDDDSGGTTIQEETIAPETTGREITGAGRTEGGTSGFFGDTNQAGTTSEDTEACPTAPSEDAVPATVERAVDGDTVELQDPVDGHDKVRLIGVNTPEMEGEDGSPEPGAEKAAEFAADALEGEQVVLETGEEVEDPYGRLLANVWLVPETGKPEFFNRTLVADGYAEVMSVEPNDAYAKCLTAAEKEAGGDNPGSEEAQQNENKDGLLGRLRNLLSADSQNDGEDTEGSSIAEDPYTPEDSTTGPSSTAFETTETVEPTVGEETGNVPSETTEGIAETTAELTGPTTQAEDLAAIPPENCPGAETVLEPFGADGEARSDPFEVTTGGKFVVRADLKSENPSDAHLNVSILDTETQEPLEEFDQRTLGSYDTVISQGPGSYFLDLQSTAGSYEAVVFDCADEEPEQSAPETPDQGSGGDPGAPLNLGSSTPPATPTATLTPPAPQSGDGLDQPEDQPSRIEFAASGEPVAPSDAESSDVALPTRDTPSGEVAVLPDTGGSITGTAIVVVVLTGALAIAAGVFGLAAFVGFGRNPGKRSGADGL